MHLDRRDRLSAGSLGYRAFAYFGYAKGSFTYDGRKTTLLPSSSPFYQAQEDGQTVWYIGSFNSLHLFFQVGSDDPEFWFTDANGNGVWGCLADEFCINAQGVIYIAGHSDKMFNERHKYIVQGNRVREQPQPYLYVGIKGKLCREAKLYSAKTGGTVVATFPAGYEIEVLLCDASEEEGQQRSYLARSAFGLVGWLRLTDADLNFSNPPVKGLGFMGD